MVDSWVRLLAPDWPRAIRMQDLQGDRKGTGCHGAGSDGIGTLRDETRSATNGDVRRGHPSSVGSSFVDTTTRQPVCRFSNAVLVNRARLLRKTSTSPRRYAPGWRRRPALVDPRLSRVAGVIVAVADSPSPERAAVPAFSSIGLTGSLALQKIRTGQFVRSFRGPWRHKGDDRRVLPDPGDVDPASREHLPMLLLTQDNGADMVDHRQRG